MKILVLEQDNCGWCTRLHPHISKFAKDLNIEIEFIDIADSWNKYVVDYGIRSTPTVIIEDDDVAMRSFSIKLQTGIAGLMREIKDFVDV